MLFFLHWNSLKTRLTLLTLAIFLVSLWSMLWFAGQMLRQDLKPLLAAQQFTTVSLVASDIEDALDFRIKTLVGLARQIAPDFLASGAAVQSQLDQHPLIEALFNRGLIAVDAQGIIMAEIPLSAQRVGIDVADRDYFKMALTQARPIVSQPLVSRKSPLPILAIAVPILDAQGQTSGVLAGIVDLSQPNFLDRMTANRYGKTGETFLVTPQTRMIVSTSDKSRIMETLPAPGANPWIDRFMLGYEGSATVMNPHGTEVLVSVKQIPSAGWYASVILSTAEAFAPIVAQRQRMLIATLFISLFTVALTWRILHRQLAPLLETTRAIVQRTTAEPSLQPLSVSLCQNDEVGQLVSGFNALLHVLARRQQALHDSKARLQLLASVFTHAREGILISTAEGTILDINEGFTRITGYVLDEVRGRNPRIFKSGRHDQSFYAAMWRDLLAHDQWSGEIWNRRKNGDHYAAMLTISAVCDERGKVGHYVALSSDITALKAHAAQLERIAHFDPLTRLPNRALLTDRLHQALVQTQRRNQRLAVVFLDLDGFKAVNDGYGHDAGDQVLIAVAERMKQALRESDTLARLGGDEFVAVLLDLADMTDGAPLFERLLAAAAQPVPFGDAQLQVSASLGVTFYPQTADIDADQLLRQADHAMYQAKLEGKNRYRAFDPNGV